MLFDVCGTPTRERVEGVLQAHGYRQVEGRPTAPGDYRYDHGDAAPGWSDWMWEFEVIERPEAPVRTLLRGL